MCLLRPKAQVKRGEKRQEYGVLMHNMEEESLCATCLMMDGRYVTLSWDHMHLAFKRVKEESYVMTEAMQTECLNMYIAALRDSTALEILIRQRELEYKVAMDAASIAHEAKVAATKARSQAKQKAPPKARMSDICLGTSVSMFFKWSELGSDGRQPAKCEAKESGTDNEGKWCTGSITNITQNQFKKWVYQCVFDTPGKFTSSFTSGEIKEARNNFLKLQHLLAAQKLNSSDDWLSA